MKGSDSGRRSCKNGSNLSRQGWEATNWFTQSLTLLKTSYTRNCCRSQTTYGMNSQQVNCVTSRGLWKFNNKKSKINPYPKYLLKIMWKSNRQLWKDLSCLFSNTNLKKPKHRRDLKHPNEWLVSWYKHNKLNYKLKRRGSSLYPNRGKLPHR